MAKVSSQSPRDLVGAGATAPGMPMPPTKMPTPGKHKAKSTSKLTTKLPVLPKSMPKPRVPAKLQPPGASQEDLPQVSPRNSQKGIKQQLGL
jgi:hypothetical protein